MHLTESLLTIQDVARRCKLAPRTIRKAISNKTPLKDRLRPIRFGHRTVRIQPVELAKWLERKRK